MSKDLMKNGKVFCVNAGWAQIKRKHEGHYIKKLNDADVKNVVKLLALSLEKACDGYDTCLGSEQLEPLSCIGYYHKRHLNHKSISSKYGESSKRSQGKSAVPDINKNPTVTGRKDRELRYTFTAWVEQAFDKACAKHLSGLSSGFSSNKNLLAVLSLWRKSFMAFEGVTKANFLHKDISFLNKRVNEITSQ